MMVTIALFVGIALGGSPFDLSFRFWFSTEGVAEHEPINGTPPEYHSPSDGVNPVLESSGRAQRLYVWGTLLNITDYLVVRAIYIDVNLHTVSGEARLTGFHWYNFTDPNKPQRRRWAGTFDGILGDEQVNDAWTGSGGNNGLAEGAYWDAQYDPNSISWLLGTVDVVTSPGAQAELFFGVGDGGIFIEGPPAPQAIYFGWGDDPLTGFEFEGAESELPDAIIIPEPATITVLGLAAGLLLHRGARCRRW
ncbi:MAG: hypothetical protein JNG88_14970 [Phycisphaerales bacterium]|nr:hypothetical protein [Phycisphaerales bacterium]